MTREIYRDRNGRFTTRAALWQGPVLPPRHPILIERKRQMLRRWSDALMEVAQAPNQMLNLLRRGGQA